MYHLHLLIQETRSARMNERDWLLGLSKVKYGCYILVKKRYSGYQLLVHQLIKKYLSIFYEEGNVYVWRGGVRRSDISLTSQSMWLRGKTQAALIYTLLFAKTDDINLPPTVPVLPSDRWLICWARGLIIDAGCSDMVCSIEGVNTAPWEVGDKSHVRYMLRQEGGSYNSVITFFQRKCLFVEECETKITSPKIFKWHKLPP